MLLYRDFDFEGAIEKLAIPSASVSLCPATLHNILPSQDLKSSEVRRNRRNLLLDISDS
jgi:hypothetical protein